ncbi:DUF1848 domain-containing protein [Gorillibacterium sp. CAU 1737]|uniref:DUF1848 domain-containing protein n=1 Tax=Gorillibacterium sp. CAU 1737 TaxID=3140362 RepID=UPI0032601D69
MIVSASRRTDIPAFYGEWLLHRIQEGYALARNPMNRRQVSRIPLTPDKVDAFVFWTKNPEPFLSVLPHLEERFPSYTQVTITPYGRDIEQALPDKKTILASFIRLAQLIGAHRTVWRYDPILLSPAYSIRFHLDAFRHMAEVLHPYTGKVVISYLDEYAKTKRNTNGLGIRPPDAEERRELAGELAQIARSFGLRIEACSEPEDYRELGVASGSCIDPMLLSAILGREITPRKDNNQRAGCQCLPSVDLGAYDTCPHQCLYCYANASQAIAAARHASHDPFSPFLFGNLEEGDRVTERQ